MNKLSHALLLDELELHLGTLAKVNCFWVAFSGGLDSTVLLHAMQQLPFKLQAIHINHGLSDEADNWSKHCQQLCSEWSIPLQIIKVNAKAKQGESPEATARDARYQAIQATMQESDCLLTAQHRDDQAETVLLQLLRGSGPSGLAAMPVLNQLTPTTHHLRPLLTFTRQQLHEYALEHGLQWIEDASNADTCFDRNFLRHKISPVLKERWPTFSKTLSRAAEHQAEAATLLAELAELDLQQLQGSQQGLLSVEGLKKLPVARQKNSLRRWIEQHEVLLPSQAKLKEIQKILSADWDKSPVVCFNDSQGISKTSKKTEIRRYRDDLYCIPVLDTALDEHDAGKTYTWDLKQDLYIESLGILLKPKNLERYDLNFEKDQILEIRFRQGGERINLPGRKHTHSLKKILQANGVPPWLRDRLPLVYVGQQLLAVIGLPD